MRAGVGKRGMTVRGDRIGSGIKGFLYVRPTRLQNLDKEVEGTPELVLSDSQGKGLLQALTQYYGG